MQRKHISFANDEYRRIRKMAYENELTMTTLIKKSTELYEKYLNNKKLFDEFLNSNELVKDLQQEENVKSSNIAAQQISDDEQNQSIDNNNGNELISDTQHQNYNSETVQENNKSNSIQHSQDSYNQEQQSNVNTENTHIQSQKNTILTQEIPEDVKDDKLAEKASKWML